MGGLHLAVAKSNTINYKSLLQIPLETINPTEYQNRIMEAYEKYGKRKNWAFKTIKNQEAILHEITKLSSKFFWELNESDIDQYVDLLINSQASMSYRRKKISTFRSFYEWLIRNYSTEVWKLFKSSLLQPVTDDNQIKHVYDLERESKTCPPSVETLNHFFDCCKKQLNIAVHPEVIGRDYTLFRLMYATGLRIDEALHLDLIDVNFSHGPLGSLHVRFGKGSRGSGKKERWVPMLTDIDKLLKWYLKHVRPMYAASTDTQALFPTRTSGRLSSSRVTDQLYRYMELFEIPQVYHWSSHKFRHAFATHNYESGMKLLSIKDLLGHSSIYTTMTYVTPSIEFVQDNISKTNARVKEYLKNRGGNPPWI